jgi:hypothetical protein
VSRLLIHEKVRSDVEALCEDLPGRDQALSAACYVLALCGKRGGDPVKHVEELLRDATTVFLVRRVDRTDDSEIRLDAIELEVGGRPARTWFFIVAGSLMVIGVFGGTISDAIEGNASKGEVSLLRERIGRISGVGPALIDLVSVWPSGRKRAE